MKSVFKIIFIVGISVISFLNANAQSTVWRQILGEQYNEIGRDVIELRDHGYLMIGEKQLEAIGFPNLVIQIYLVKLDKFGNIEWEKIIGDSVHNNECSSATEDIYGNIYLPYRELSTGHLLKMNSDGTILWDRNYSTTNIRYFSGISFVDNFEKLLIVGLNQVSTLISSSITKLDSSGNLIWTKAYYDSIPSLSAYSSYNNCYLFLDTYYFISGNKGINGFIIKTDTSGNRIWTNRYTQSQYIMSMVKNSENTFIATGLGRSGTYCMKFDQNGGTIWSRDYGIDTSKYFGYSKITRYYDGNFAIGTVNGDNVTRIGIIDSLGNILSIYRNTYPENILLSQENLNSTTDSGLVLTGYYGIFEKDLNNASVRTDVIIFKVDKNGNMVAIKNNTEIITDNFTLSQNYPNPFNPATKINYELSASRGERVTNYVSVIVYDVLGNEVRTLVNENKPAGSYKVEFNGSNLPSGVYFYSLLIDGNVMDTKRMVLLK